MQEDRAAGELKSTGLLTIKLGMMAELLHLSAPTEAEQAGQTVRGFGSTRHPLRINPLNSSIWGGRTSQGGGSDDLIQRKS